MLNCIPQKYCVKIKRFMYANIFIISWVMTITCAQIAGKEPTIGWSELQKTGVVKAENPYPRIDEIPLPAGYRRLEPGSNNFGSWLRKLPLKKDKQVFLYNGERKRNQDAQFAVLDLPIGDRDLQQCADAIMRLRAEYQFDRQAYDKICFWDNNGAAYRFTAPHTRKNLASYLLGVFGRSGSASLEKQLHKKPFHQMIAGDVLIRGGFPGHAVIVMDMAMNANGEKIYLLAQGYMPAQDIHVLLNPSDANLSPWYKLNEAVTILTPEYIFTSAELKTW